MAKALCCAEMTGLGASRQGLFLAMAIAFAAPTAMAQQACQAVSEQIRAFSPPVWEKDPPRAGVLALDRLPNGILYLSPGRSLTRQEIAGVLRDEFQAMPSILDPMTRLSGIRTARFILYRFGQSSLYAAEMADGYSQFFNSFAVTPEGRADVTSEAKAVMNTLRLHCSGPDNVGRVGDVGGVPAFICERGTDREQEITIEQPLSGVWQQSCRIGLRFSAEFKAIEQFCERVDCAVVAEQALAQVRRYEKQPFAVVDPAVRPIWNSEKFQRMLRIADDTQQGLPMLDPPYFNKPDTNAPVYMGSRYSAVEPFVLGGETYIARFGHAYSGWRAYSDYLFALYRLADDQLQPVAGFYITMTLTAPVEVTVK